MKLIDLKRTKKEKTEEAKEYASPVSTAANMPDYPYGLCVCLDDDVIDKLGLAKDLPDVGEEFVITARAKVTAVRQNANESSDNKSVEMQITSLALGDPDEKSGLRKEIEKAAG